MDFSHPAFNPYRPLLASLPQHRLPNAAELTSLAQEAGRTLRFVATTSPLSACDYERSILETGTIYTRPDNLHDFMNAMVWLTFPQTKAGLNRIHCRTLADNPAEAKQRGRLRDAVTLLDESGLMVFTDDVEFLPLLGGRRWREVFIQRRQNLVSHSQFLLIGHALLENLLDPYLSITAKCLVMLARPKSLAEADQNGAAALESIDTPRRLPPLPVAGIPGWHPHNQLAAFYDNTAIFRPLAH